MSHRAAKDSMYADAGVRKLSCSNRQSLGFFTPFSSLSDFRSQLKAPVVMPILCVAHALGHALDLLKQGLLVGVNLALLDFSTAGKHCKNFFHDTLGAIYLAYSAVVDTFWAIACLATRTVGSLFSVVGAGLRALIDCGDSTEKAEVVYPPQMVGYPPYEGFYAPTTDPYTQFYLGR